MSRDDAAMRIQLRADRPPAELLPAITKDGALEVLRRYRDLYPAVAPEVTAVHLLRRADSWDEVRAVEAALDVVLKEGDEE